MNIRLISIALLTFLIEYPVVRSILGKKRLLLPLTLCVNLLTNLSLNVFIHTFMINEMISIVMMEIIIWIIECMIYSYAYTDLSKKKVWFTIIAANMISFVVGMVIVKLL